MLLLGHAAVSARRGPRGTCQETRAALWAPAECGVTARSASDGVDVNGIRVHHRRLQYRKYQCGMFSKPSPVPACIDTAGGSWASLAGEVPCLSWIWLAGPFVPAAVPRLRRGRRVSLGWKGGAAERMLHPDRFTVDSEKVPSARSLYPLFAGSRFARTPRY